MPRNHESGSLTLLAIFIYFLFSALGLGLICLAQLHLKISAYRKSSTLLAYAAENGIKQEFAFLAAKVAAAGGPAVCAEARYAGLQAEFEAGEMGIIAEVLGAAPPFAIEGGASGQTWTAGTEFALEKITAVDRFFIADFRGTSQSTGRLAGFVPEKKASLDVALRILAGHIPLAYFPVLIAGNTPPEERQRLLRDESIVPIPQPGTAAPPPVSFAEDEVAPAEADLLLKKAARVKFLTPGKLTRGELRTALGLEMVDEPVPEGVYLMESDAGLGGIFVQGDLDEMVLAIDGDFQAMAFARGDRSWLLKFSLAQGRTIFASAEGLREFDRIPLGIVLVNGAIGALGGGLIGPDGSAEIVADSAAPCVLRGASLTIVASDKVTISSPLIQQGVKWVGSIPYLKDSTSQLILYATGRDLVGDETREGSVLIDPHTPREIAIQASIAAKTEFRSAGESKNILIAGGIQTAGIALNGSTLKVLPDERLQAPGWAPDNAPATARPLIAVLSLKPLQWRDE
jgi:hypothetical protein